MWCKLNERVPQLKVSANTKVSRIQVNLLSGAITGNILCLNPKTDVRFFFFFFLNKIRAGFILKQLVINRVGVSSNLSDNT